MYNGFTKNDYENEIAYLRQALIQSIQSMQAVADNVASGRFAILVLDDGPAKPANIATLLDNLQYAVTCEKLTNPYIRQS